MKIRNIALFIIYSSFIGFLLLLSSCEKNAESFSRSSNPDFKIHKLFTCDGITVYRFEDGLRSHYFTSMGETITTQRVYAGKYVVCYEENISGIDQ